MLGTLVNVGAVIAGSFGVQGFRCNVGSVLCWIRSGADRPVSACARAGQRARLGPGVNRSTLDGVLP